MPNEHLSTEAERHPLQVSKKIAKVTQAHYGHVHVEFEDGSMDVIRREELKGAKIQAGEYWPTLPEELELSPIQEESHAVDQETSGKIVEQGQPAIEQAAKQDEIGTPSESSDGAREEGQSSS